MKFVLSNSLWLSLNVALACRAHETSLFVKVVLANGLSFVIVPAAFKNASANSTCKASTMVILSSSRDRFFLLKKRKGKQNVRTKREKSNRRKTYLDIFLAFLASLLITLFPFSLAINLAILAFISFSTSSKVLS